MQGNFNTVHSFFLIFANYRQKNSPLKTGMITLVKISTYSSTFTPRTASGANDWFLNITNSGKCSMEREQSDLTSLLLKSMEVTTVKSPTLTESLFSPL